MLDDWGCPVEVMMFPDLPQQQPHDLQVATWPRMHHHLQQRQGRDLDILERKVNTEKLTTTSSPWRSGDLYPMVWQQVGFVAAVCRICRSHLQRLPIPQQEWKLIKVSLKFSTPPWYFQTYPKIMTSKKQSPPPWCCWTSPRSSGQLWPGWN